MAHAVGRVRLELDCEAALARLFLAQGKSGAAQHHGDTVRALATAIGASLESSGLEARLRLPADVC